MVRCRVRQCHERAVSDASERDAEETKEEVMTQLSSLSSMLLCYTFLALYHSMRCGKSISHYIGLRNGRRNENGSDVFVCGKLCGRRKKLG